MKDTYVLKHCRLIQELSEEGAPAFADVVISDGIIASIKESDTEAYEGIDSVDLKEKTLMPGIIDAHIHLSMTETNPAEANYVDPCTRTLRDLKYAGYLLDIGVTTVRDCGEDRYFSVTALRNGINEGIVQGPHIYTSGITMTPTNAGGTPDSEFGYMVPYNVDSREDMRRAVRINFAHGADFIKLYGTGSMMGKGSVPGIGIMEDDEILEAVRIAAENETYCAIHCHGAKAIVQALKCGVRTIEHASFIDEEGLDLLSGRKDAGIIPTLSVTMELIEHTDPDSEYGKHVISKVSALLEQIRTCLNGAYQRGDILIGWGTDQSLAAYVREPGSEFRHRHDFLGWKNIDILKQATISSAVLMGIDDHTGSVAAGKDADLIAVEGDPAEDITIMYQKPEHVFLRGRMIR